eukprot:5776352-Amphidinium_carterae.1
MAPVEINRKPCPGQKWHQAFDAQAQPGVFQTLRTSLRLIRHLCEGQWIPERNPRGCEMFVLASSLK